MLCPVAYVRFAHWYSCTVIFVTFFQIPTVLCRLQQDHLVHAHGHEILSHNTESTRSKESSSAEEKVGEGVKYAFCVAGQVRSFHGTHVALKDVLVDGFGDPNAAARDLFLVLDPHCTNAREHNSSPCQEDFEEHLEGWKQKLQWKALKVFDQEYNTSNDILPENHCNDDPGKRMFPNRDGYYDASFYHMHLKHQMCYDLVKQQEEKNGWKYDWIMSTRPDKPWRSVGHVEMDTSFIYTLDDCNVRQFGALICDMFYAVPRQLADIVYTTKDQFMKCVNLDENAPSPNIKDYPVCHVKSWSVGHGTPPECLFSAHLLDAHLQDKIRDLPKNEYGG